MSFVENNATATLLAGIVGAIATTITAIYGPSISRKLNKPKGDIVDVVSYYQNIIAKLEKTIASDERVISYLRRREQKAATKQHQLQEIINSIESRKARIQRHKAALEDHIEAAKTVPDSQESSFENTSR